MQSQNPETFYKVRSELHASVEFEKLSAKPADFAGYSTRVEDDRRPTYQPNLQSILIEVPNRNLMAPLPLSTWIKIFLVSSYQDGPQK